MILKIERFFLVGIVAMLLGCDKQDQKANKQILLNPEFTYGKFDSNTSDIIISRKDYYNKLYGFWLGQCIANWTGLVTEMDKIGGIGDIKTGKFYTREEWGKLDQPSIWGEGVPSELSETIDFVIRDSTEIWGADDDTDIEYMYQQLIYTNKTSILTSQMIKEGWLKHIKPEEENFLWVSNQRAFDLMKEGVLPPETGTPGQNEHYEMIDAQLTTELFGLLSPTNPEIALKMANLPIRTVASSNAAWISEFYIIMHALASRVDQSLTIEEQTKWLAEMARLRLPNDSYSAKMYDYVKRKYESNITWEQTRDSIYLRYQVNEEDGYNITSKNLYCNGCFASGINYAASLVSLFYGEGDFKETIKIGALCGWDSDNPTATWGGLLGFIQGKDNIQSMFGNNLSEKFNIHRTRQNFENNGLDTFDNMAKKGIFIIDRVVQEEMNGGIDLTTDSWHIPKTDLMIKPSRLN